jgi:hypothetical protein
MTFGYVTEEFEITAVRPVSLSHRVTLLLNSFPSL